MRFSLSLLINILIAYFLAIFVGGTAFTTDFSSAPMHAFAAKALAEGHLFLPVSLKYGLQFDLQFFNGSVFTHWGYGVPLVLLAIGKLIGLVAPSGEFQMVGESTGFWVFAALTGTIFSILFSRQSSEKESPSSFRSHFGSIALAAGFFWFMFAFSSLNVATHRFLQYEVNIAMMITALLLVFPLLIRGLSERLGPFELAVLGLYFGLAMLIRPSAIVVASPFLAAFAFCNYRRLAIKNWLCLGSTMAPLMVFLAYSNWNKSGSPLSFGFINSISGYTFETSRHRFGTACFEDPQNAFHILGLILQSLFVSMVDLKQFNLDCNFIVEGSNISKSAFLSPLQLGLAAGASAILWRTRKEKWVVINSLLAILLLTACYVWAGSAITYRYSGDYHLALLAPIIAVFIASNQKRLEIITCALIFFLAFGYFSFFAKHQFTETTHLIKLNQLESYHGDFIWYRNAHQEGWNSTTQDFIPSVLECSEIKSRSDIAGQNRGWLEGCSTWSFTNTFIGLPPNTGGTNEYTLTFEIDGKPQKEFVDIVVNGSKMRARATETGYLANFNLDPMRFRENIVQISVEWNRSYQQSGPILRRIRLLAN